MLSFDMGAGVGRSYRYYTGKNLLYPMGFGNSRTKHSWGSVLGWVFQKIPS